MTSTLTSGSEPCTYKEAMKRDDAGLWQEASQYEFDALQKHDVWELCELPPGRKAVGCRWVYRIKTSTVRLGYMYTYLYTHVVPSLLVHAWSHQYTPLQRTTARV